MSAMTSAGLKREMSHATRLGNPPISAPLLLRQPDVVRPLQIQPELPAHVKPVTEPQGRVPGNIAAAIDELRNAAGWHSELAGGFSRGNSEFSQFISQNFARVDRGT